MPQIDQMLRDLQGSRFYGSLEFKLEAGRIVLLKKTETIKPTDYRISRGDTNAKNQE